jgi:hypothetical protein
MDTLQGLRRAFVGGGRGEEEGCFFHTLDRAQQPRLHFRVRGMRKTAQNKDAIWLVELVQRGRKDADIEGQTLDGLDDFFQSKRVDGYRMILSCDAPWLCDLDFEEMYF